jgi:branched-chain amino acid transport system permease protein
VINRKSFRNLALPGFYVPALALTLLAIAPFVVSNYYIIDVLTVTMLFAVVSAAWNILGGYAGQFSMGHSAFFGIAAYTSTILFLDWNISPWLGMFVGFGISLIIGLSTGALFFKLNGPYFTFVTIAFAETLRILFINLTPITGGANGLNLQLLGDAPINFQFASRTPFYLIMLLLMVSVVLFTYKIRNSRTGLRFVALREDEKAAQSLGINVLRHKLLALTASIFFVSIAGTFYAQFMLFIDPESTMSLNLSLLIALPAIIGGLGTIAGPILGSFLLRPISEVTRIFLGGSYAGLSLLIYGVILILTLLFLPNGITAKISKAYKAALKKLPGGERE